MITWMQRHRKYLVVTIWISTIAFVGAGFVGWGSYQYGSKSGSIGLVGDEPITAKDYNRKYQDLYGYYNQQMGGKLDQEQAKKMGLHNQVISALTQEAMFINYAKELGLSVGSKEVQEDIISDEQFAHEGKFNKDIYFKTLKQVGLRASEYEELVQKRLLMQKLFDVFAPQALKVEEDMLSMAVFGEDRISYKILSTSDLNSSEALDEEALKAYWQSNKERYKSDKSFEVAYLESVPSKDVNITTEEINEHYQANKSKYINQLQEILPLEEVEYIVRDELILNKGKKEALLMYKRFKGKKIDSNQTRTITYADVPVKIYEALESATVGDFIKPKVLNNLYLIMKVNKINEPQTKSFEMAYEAVKADYLANKEANDLEKLAKTMLASFSGKDSGFIGKDSLDAIEGLNKEETMQFLTQLFTSNSKKGSIKVADKIILFDIIDQRLSGKDEFKELLDDNIVKLKTSLINAKILETLHKKYGVEIYLKGE